MDTHAEQLESTSETVHGIQRELETLNASTERILNHVKIIEEQRQFLRAQRASQVTSKLTSSTSEQETLQVQHIKLLNAETAHTLSSKLQKQQEGIDYTSNAAVSRTQAKLSTDDRNLDVLNESLSRGTAPSLLQLSQSGHRNTQLLTALRNATCEHIKLKLNHTYLQALHSGSKNIREEELDDSQVQDVYDDLSNLFAEIEGVTELFVSHDYGEQLGETWKCIGHLEQKNRVDESQRISDQLGLLTEDLSKLAAQNEKLLSHRTALVRLRQLQHKINRSHETRPSETSHAAAMPSPRVDSLRRQLGSFSPTSLLDTRKSVDQRHDELRDSIERSKAASTRQHGTMLGNSMVNLKAPHLMLVDLDREIASSKAMVDNASEPSSKHRTAFKDEWEGSCSRT